MSMLSYSMQNNNNNKKTTLKMMNKSPVNIQMVIWMKHCLTSDVRYCLRKTYRWWTMPLPFLKQWPVVTLPSSWPCRRGWLRGPQCPSELSLCLQGRWFEHVPACGQEKPAVSCYCWGTSHTDLDERKKTLQWYLFTLRQPQYTPEH